MSAARQEEATTTVRLALADNAVAATEFEWLIQWLDRPRLWVNIERTVLARSWQEDRAEVAMREHPDHTWGPPIALYEEKS